MRSLSVSVLGVWDVMMCYFPCLQWAWCMSSVYVELLASEQRSGGVFRKPEQREAGRVFPLRMCRKSRDHTSNKLFGYFYGETPVAVWATFCPVQKISDSLLMTYLLGWRVCFVTERGAVKAEMIGCHCSRGKVLWRESDACFPLKARLFLPAVGAQPSPARLVTTATDARIIM